MTPPRLVRRLVVDPLAVVVALALLVLTPALLLVAVVLTPLLPGRMRAPRSVLLAARYLLRELGGLAVATWLWLRGDRGRRLRTEPAQTRVYRLMAWFVGGLARDVDRLVGVRVEVSPEAADAEAQLRAHTAPVIVLSRHAGPGDSFLLVALMLERWARRPSIVMKRTLQWDPCIDVATNRVPSCFVGGHDEGEDTVQERIAATAARMDARGALLLFPEGGNFTPARRRRAVLRLLRLGARHRAREAVRMEHVLAPRTGGVAAALRGNPHADVVVVAHTGLAGLDRSIWARIPLDCSLRMHLWYVRRGDVPATPDLVDGWLYDWWARIDDWVGDRRPAQRAS